MSKILIIYGSGGHGKVALDIAVSAGLEVEYIVDDLPKLKTLWSYPVISSHSAEWKKLKSFQFLVGIGENCIRERIFQMLLRKGGEPTTIRHPSAVVSTSAQIGSGTLICAGSVINVSASIEENCIVNTSASVDHDCSVGANVHLCPGVHLAGNVTIGAMTMIGTGAVVLPGLFIGTCCIVGAGSVVTHSLPSKTIAYGNPARVRKTAGAP